MTNTAIIYALSEMPQKVPENCVKKISINIYKYLLKISSALVPFMQYQCQGTTLKSCEGLA